MFVLPAGWIPGNTIIGAANRTTIWAIETDEDGLDSLVRYRIR